MANPNPIDEFLKPEEVKRQTRSLMAGLWGYWRAPIREKLWEFAKRSIKLPHSARSQSFDIEISPWLKKPAECITDGRTKEMTLVGAVQGAKTTLAEICVPYWMMNDPGPLMWNAQTDPDAHDQSVTRIIPMLKKSPCTKKMMADLPKRCVTQGYLETPAMWAIFQGAHTRTNLQSKTIRYLVNDEPWMYPPGNLEEAYKRVTAYWNSFILNISTGGADGDSFHEKWKNSTQHHYYACCPICKNHFLPSFSRPKDKTKPGGMRFDSTLKTKEGNYDWPELTKSIHYSCPVNGCEIYDTPVNRQFMAYHGQYFQKNMEADPRIQGFTYSSIIVYWVPFTTLVREFLTANLAMRYGDETLLKEFIQKRCAEFWDPTEHRPVVAQVKTSLDFQMNQGMPDRDFRAMTVDEQREKGEHYWAVIRDWHQTKGSRLVHYERIETPDQLRAMQLKYEVEDKLVWIDCADNTTKVQRLASKYGWVCIHGSDRKSYPHQIENSDGEEITVQRIYSQLTFSDPFVGTETQGTKQVGIIYFSKHFSRERLFALRNGDVDYKWEVPPDVGDEYHLQMDSEEKRTRVIPRSQERVEEYVQVRKNNHLLVCEVFQTVIASIMGLIGDERAEQEMKNVPTKSPAQPEGFEYILRDE